MYKVAAGDKLQPVLSEVDVATRRQDLPPIYVLNGAIYIAQIDWLRANKSFVGGEAVAYLMPKERSLDIDTAQDFEIFRSVIEGEKYSLAKNSTRQSQK